MQRIHVPTDVFVKCGIQQGSIYNFSPKDGVPNHYYVVVNKDPKGSDILYLAPFTTKIQNVQQFLMLRKLDLSTLVLLSVGECSFLPRAHETGIDCNRLIPFISLDALASRIDETDGGVRYPLLEPLLLEKVIDGVRSSKMVAAAVKQLL